VCADEESQSAKAWAPMLIMLPLRLGLDRINEDYAPVLKETFRIPQSIGISGGKPRASLYFVGNQGIVTRPLSMHALDVKWIVSDGLHACRLQTTMCSIWTRIRCNPHHDSPKSETCPLQRASTTPTTARLRCGCTFGTATLHPSTYPVMLI
jgi:hypothetical protein